jgi:DNA-binding transcriptional LysR family regulator
MANLWLLQTSDMLSIASGRVAEHFTNRGLVKALNFDMDAEGSIGVCWRDEPYIDNAVVDFRECLLKASGQDGQSMNHL